MLSLPVEERGYPVPKFVEWIDGKPDFRVASREHYNRCIKQRVCWLCGMDLGAKAAFVIGPMCAVNRVSSEPPNHPECARFAAMACPFLVRPHARRREAGLPENPESLGGCGIKRNPGVAVVWITTAQGWRVFDDSMGGKLFHVGDPIRTEWYREGRPATRAECLESIERGLPELVRVAKSESHVHPTALAELEKMTTEAYRHLPRAEP